MKKILALTASALVLLTVTGCSVSETGELDPDQAQEVTYTMKDGRTMDCILYGIGHGSLDCDWEGAK